VLPPVDQAAHADQQNNKDYRNKFSFQAPPL
jgi:hypothetical protein